MPGAHRLLDRGAVEPVDDDLQHRVDCLRQLAGHAEPSAQRRAVGVVGRRDHVLVALRADLAAGADDAAGKRQDDAADPVRIASTAASAAASAASWSFARISRLPPPIACCTPNVSSTRNSPSITGIAPVAPAVQELARLERSPKWRSMPPTTARSGACRQAVKTRRRRTGEHRLAHALDQPGRRAPPRRTRRGGRWRRAVRPASRRLEASASIPASTLQPMTEVAKPVIDWPPCAPSLGLPR